MQQLVMPNVGEGVAEGTVTQWLKHEGDTVAADEPVVEIETDKAVVEIPSPYSGTLARILVQEGETVPIGTTLAEFETEGAAVAPRESPAPSVTAAAPAGALAAARGVPIGAARRTRRYSPVVLKLAEEHDVDLSLVRGTGVEGRVTRQDVLAYVENPVLHAAPPPEGSGVVGATKRDGAAAQTKPAPQATKTEAGAPASQDGLIPLSATRRTIAARMLESQRTIPAAWMVVEADVTGLASLRSRLKEEFRRAEGVDLTYLPFFLRAVVAGVKEHPEINVLFAEEGLRPQQGIHLGIAVATEAGLVVPVLRDAGDLSITGLAKEAARLGERARSRKLTVDEMRGCAITVDNTGSFGSIMSQPIVPPGQTAIITLEAIRREVRVTDEDAIAIRSVVNVCISFDHRALDGEEVGRFMQAVRGHLESITADGSIDDGAG
ncbi:MAG: 2-oxo acid dehydrogenase subunit E2 [Chloroflexi bacterium]|nr:2-oxo acid dehydrogenase subunit E2 [Chloroflexota bacterium]